MKNKILTILLSVFLVISIIGNYLQVLVLNDQVNTEKSIILCLSELDGTPLEELSVVDVQNHISRCVKNNTSLK